MPHEREISAKKQAYRARLEKYLEDYRNVLICEVEMVGSRQMQQVRQALRGKGVLLMGKNTIVRKVLRESVEKHPKVAKLLNFVYGKVGLVFTNCDLAEMRKTIVDIKTPAPARVGSIAPSDCFVPAGPTGLDPGQTSFFQALNIATKIVKGTIEIMNNVHLIRVGDKVTPSAVSLLSKLDIKPFFYGLIVSHIYENGSIYPSSVLDITPETLLGKFMNGVGKLAALSLAAKFPSELTIAYYMANGFRKLLAISAATNYKFKQAEDILNNAAKAAPAAAAAPAAGGAKGGAAPAAAAKKDEPAPAAEEEGDVGVGGLFD